MINVEYPDDVQEIEFYFILNLKNPMAWLYVLDYF